MLERFAADRAYLVQDTLKRVLKLVAQRVEVIEETVKVFLRLSTTLTMVLRETRTHPDKRFLVACQHLPVKVRKLKREKLR